MNLPTIATYVRKYNEAGDAAGKFKGWVALQLLLGKF
jgi:hypothetical protein